MSQVELAPGELEEEEDDFDYTYMGEDFDAEPEDCDCDDEDCDCDCDCCGNDAEEVDDGFAEAYAVHVNFADQIVD
jgi:hypothetical protein